MPTFIEVCSGLISAGLTPLLLNEIDNVCCETLRLNHPNIPIHKGNFMELYSRTLSGILPMSGVAKCSLCTHVDILVGGVPCQSFSYAGRRKGFEDKRGNLLLEFINLIKKYKPKVFMIENVKGLLNHDKGNTLKIALDKIPKEYDVIYKVLNANDYGVAQKRERLFIVGNRLNKKFIFPSPNKYKPVLRDVLLPCPKDNAEGTSYSQKKEAVLELVPPGGCWVNLPENIQKEYMGY